ncbi:MAG TPA: hypothetical protein P5526_01705 [Anaerolineae bacterium]|nr:hypothetical protein [Anaerolineae bacterium]MCB0177076.1 hypothetical protein [Anaerolineae bacterium]MCB0222197.1 hypothetical protein [Anaerolineae bacterium]MCB9107802.1 hypothetical protein [Anaerolineales bacterium]HRV90857.1 hypothetical protein [Anaerolineae bacterium]
MDTETQNNASHFTAEDLDLIEYLVKQALEHSSRMGQSRSEQYQQILDKLPFYRAVAWQISRR